MFTSEKKGDLVIGGQDVPEMSDLYRVTLPKWVQARRNVG
jgi:hypothetical protein